MNRYYFPQIRWHIVVFMSVSRNAIRTDILSENEKHMRTELEESLDRIMFNTIRVIRFTFYGTYNIGIVC